MGRGSTKVVDDFLLQMKQPKPFHEFLASYDILSDPEDLMEEPESQQSENDDNDDDVVLDETMLIEEEEREEGEFPRITMLQHSFLLEPMRELVKNGKTNNEKRKDALMIIEYLKDIYVNTTMMEEIETSEKRLREA